MVSAGLPVFSREVMEEDQHLQLSKLIARAGVGPVPEGHESVGFWSDLQRMNTERETDLSAEEERGRRLIGTGGGCPPLPTSNLEGSKISGSVKLSGLW